MGIDLFLSGIGVLTEVDNKASDWHAGDVDIRQTQHGYWDGGLSIRKKD